MIVSELWFRKGCLRTAFFGLEPYLEGSGENMLELFLRDELNAKVTGIIKGNVVFPMAQLVGEIKGGAFRNGNADAA